MVMFDYASACVCACVCEERGSQSHHSLGQSLLHQGDAALVDGLAVGQKAALQRRGHGRQALQQGEEVLVLVLQLVPLGDERRHQLLDVLLKKCINLNSFNFLSPRYKPQVRLK